MFESLRKYEVQARYSAALALSSLAPFFFALFLVWTRLNLTLGRIVYGAEGRFVIAFVGCVLASLAPSAVGFVLGWNSVGQRRNEKSGRSWVGFFIGGGVLTFDLILLIAFFMLRLKV